MDVIGYRNVERKWKYNIELFKRNGQGYNVCEFKYTTKLYEAIQKSKTTEEKITIENDYKTIVNKIHENKKEKHIGYDDFLVITNEFRCLIKEHRVEEVLGIIKLETRLGTIIEKKIPCVYCPVCNCYFILTTQYKVLSIGNFFLCNIMESDEYIKYGKKGIVRKNTSSERIPKIKKEQCIKQDDFVVVTNVFRCYFKNHNIEEVLGIIKLETRQGTIIEEKIPCAYCPTCDCYFILTSQYKTLSIGKFLLCRLLEKDEYVEYVKNGIIGGATESLLMVNGYNVKSTVGLTDTERHTILKKIMDSNILSPHVIASYLDMFIVQKKNLSQYQNAIAKWTHDKKFVLSYEENKKRKVRIENSKLKNESKLF